MQDLRSNLFDGLDSPSATRVIIGFGLLLRILALLFFVHLPLIADALCYHDVARQLLRGEHFAPFWPPGLPYCLSFFYAIFGPSELVGRSVMLGFYLLFSLALFLLTREVTSTRTANATVLFFAVFPAFISYSVETLTQLPTAACLAGVAYLVVALKKTRRWTHAVLLGLALALLILTRASSLPFLVLIPAYLLVRTRSLRAALLPLGVSLLLVGGWIGQAHAMTGRWIMINDANSMNFFFGNNPYTPLYKTWWFGSHGRGEPDVPEAYLAMAGEIDRLPPEMRNAGYTHVALDHIASRPDLFVIRTANRVRNYFAFDTFTGGHLIKGYAVNKALGLAVIVWDALFYCAVMLAALRGLFELRAGSPHLEHVLVLLGLGICYAGPYWISFSHPTYHFPVVPLCGVIAATWVENRTRAGRGASSWLPAGRRRFAFVVLALVFAYIQLEWIFVMRSRI